VTLCLRHTGGGPRAEALARAFDAREGGAVATRDAPDDRLPPAAIRRALVRSGGDLSVDLEPHRGSRLTLYLPCAAEGPAAKSRPAQRDSAPAMAGSA
jgi:hypothetical protein